MSFEAIVKFYEKVKNDVELQDKIMHMGVKTAEEALEAVTKLANSSGFDFGREDLDAYARQIVKQFDKDGELNEADLDSVAGGGSIELELLSMLTGGWDIGSLTQRAIGNDCSIKERISCS